MDRNISDLTTPEIQLRAVLRVFVVAFGIATLIYAFGPFVGPLTGFMRRLPFAAYSVPKVLTLGLVCLYGAGDPRRRIGLAWIAVAGHALSIVAMLVALVLGDTSVAVQFGASQAPVPQLLWGAIALDGVILFILLYFTTRAAAAIRVATLSATRADISEARLAAPGRGLKLAMISLATLFALLGLACVVAITIPSMQPAFVTLPFVTNTVVLLGTLSFLSLYIASHIEERIGLVSILAWSHVVSAVTQLLFSFGASGEDPVEIGGRVIEIATILIVGGVVDATVAVMLFVLLNRAYRRIFRPTFLTIRGYRTLIASADVLVHGPSETISPERIAANVDRYFGSMRTKRRWVHQASLLAVHFHPLLYLLPPLSEIDPSGRMNHLRRHFFHEVALRVVPEFWRKLVSGIIRVTKQLAYVGYYNDKDADKAVGYTRFEQRERVKGKVPPRSPPLELEVQTAETIDVLHEETDICVIGSGAAGAILAYRLAETGQRVLILERGRYVEPRFFNDNEVEMIGKLYDDGVFQQTRDLRFSILQGSCVGGSTVVNNAVCFPPPQSVVTHWNDQWRWNAGINVNELSASVTTVTNWLPIAPKVQAILNPSYVEYEEGIRKLGMPAEELRNQVVSANIRDCPGCGYCNIGCAYGKKLSMLDTVLPWSQKQFGDRVRIIAEAPVERILLGRRGAGGDRVEIVRARLSDNRLLTVRAKKVVVAAGAVASSYILLSSGLGRGLPVGRGLSFNMGAPLTAEFDREMNAYDGLQISHATLPRSGRGWVFETWWNPPVAQALNMPGWFEQHFQNMRRYPYLMAVGALVGTESNARVTRALTGGPDVDYEPTLDDRRKLADALIELGRLLFAGGARRVMVNSWNYYEFRSPHSLSDITRIVCDPEEMPLGTGHPQGGNAMSQDPQWGVVGPDFRVHGYENLFVCDASVIPSSLTVNPQLTVMSLAQYAAPRIAAAS